MNAITIKDIFNACHNYRQFIRGLLLEMQHLVKFLVDNKYMFQDKKYLQMMFMGSSRFHKKKKNTSSDHYYKQFFFEQV